MEEMAKAIQPPLRRRRSREFHKHDIHFRFSFARISLSFAKPKISVLHYLQEAVAFAEKWGLLYVLSHIEI